jgi:hypothetical protein
MKKSTKTLGALVVALGLCAIPRTSHAAGSYKFCPRWGYTFNDQGQGEDYLLHQSGLTYGLKPAAYSWAEVYRDGALVWSGYMNSSGCTGTISGVAGLYEVWTTPELATPSGSWIGVSPYSDWVWRWFSASHQLTAAPNGQTFTYYDNVGIGDSVSNVAAAVTQLAAMSDSGLGSGFYYSIYAEEQCPGAISCYTDGAVFLGWNTQIQNWDSFLKSVVLHETGHNIQDWLFGTQKHDYTSGNSTSSLCNCDHVFDPADRQHCIQSREMSSASQLEGFGHFVATMTQNNAANSNAWFPYYKDVKWTDNQVYPPPYPINSYSSGLWMEAHCSGANTNEGTEMDWLNFYYWINRKASATLSLADLRSVYRQACGGHACSSTQDSTWNSLKAATVALWGANDGRTTSWSATGDLVGVDH